VKRADLAGAIEAAWAADAPIYDDLPGHGLCPYQERCLLYTVDAADAQLSVTLRWCRVQ